MLPMINVVFLLLIFFLMVAQLKQPEAFAVTPPTTSAAQDRAEAKGEFTLLMSATALPGYRDTTGEAAFAALDAARAAHCAGVDCNANPPKLTLRADPAMPAAGLAATLPRLAASGFAEVRLVTQPGEDP